MKKKFTWIFGLLCVCPVVGYAQKPSVWQIKQCVQSLPVIRFASEIRSQKDEHIRESVYIKTSFADMKTDQKGTGYRQGYKRNFGHVFMEKAHVSWKKAYGSHSGFFDENTVEHGSIGTYRGYLIKGWATCNRLSDLKTSVLSAENETNRVSDAVEDS